MRHVLLLTALACTLLLTACSFEASIGGGIDSDKVVEGIVAIGDEQLPEGSPWEADCSDVDFADAEDGDTYECVAIASDGTELPAVVTVVDAKAGDINVTIN